MQFLYFLLIVAAFFGTAVWLVRDASKRGTNGLFIALLFGWLGPLAVLGWLLLRPPIQQEIRSYADFTCPEDAFEFAAQLEIQGEWAAAIELYQYIADRWPDQMSYSFACIREIHAKQDMAEID